MMDAAEPIGTPGWGYDISNLDGVTPSVTPGTSFNIGGGNTDGTPVAVLTAARDIELIVIKVGGASTGAEDNSALMDILADPSGGTSWGNWIDDLVIGASSQPSAIANLAHLYFLPVWAKAGTQFAVQARKNGATTATGRIIMWCFGKPKRPTMWWCGQKVESLGINAASSKGTTHTAGNSGTFSSYATVGTSTRIYRSLQFGFNAVDANTQQNAYHWQIGAGGSKLAGTPTLYCTTSTGEIGVRESPGPIFVDVPASTALQVRGTATGTAEAADVALYGFY